MTPFASSSRTLNYSRPEQGVKRLGCKATAQRALVGQVETKAETNLVGIPS